MILVVFYTLAIAMGYGLLFLFVKYNGNKKIYYFGWFIAIVILSTISTVMGEPVDYIFESSNYDALPTWLYWLFMIFILVPAVFLTYPFVQFYKWLSVMIEDLYNAIMQFFVPSNKKAEIIDEDNTKEK